MTPPQKSSIAAGETSGKSEDGYTPVSVEIAAGVRELILSGRLDPGERIRQHELATDNGVSRLPVREALRQLENEGLVVQVPHSGARVSSISQAECAELYKLREVLEPTVLAQSVPHLTEADLNELELCLARLEAVDGDVAGWLMQDRLFHVGSFRTCGMPTGLNLVERFYNQTLPFRRSYYGGLDDAELKVVHLEHRLLFDAIARKDPSDAHAYQRSHIRRTRLELMKNQALAEPAIS
jgi:DNA-binding GntR family transcriptional regulator